LTKLIQDVLFFQEKFENLSKIKGENMQEISARGIFLNEITESDLPILYKWRNSSHFIDSCSTRRNIIDFGKFKEELISDFQKDRHIQCMIRLTKKPIGTIYSYNLNKTDGYVFVTTYLEIGNERKGYGAVAFSLFVNFLFQSLDLYKVYCDVYSYNTESLKVLKNAGFVEEGIFKGHRLLNSKRYDLVRLAFFREMLEDKKIILSRLTKIF
jgi:RimJ/RimL family protein N-acetyltransferase